MSLARFFIIGIVTAGLMGGCAPLLALGELAGPINFAIPLSLFIIIGLVLVCLKTKPRGWAQGIVGAVAFSVPIVIVCLAIPYFVGDEHASEARWTGMVAVVVSIIITLARAMEVPPAKS